jgi:hypothetical protein
VPLEVEFDGWVTSCISSSDDCGSGSGEDSDRKSVEAFVALGVLVMVVVPVDVCVESFIPDNLLLWKYDSNQ